MSKMDMVSTIPLERGWSAVLHAPLAGAGVLAVELLHHQELQELVQDLDEVDALVEVLLREPSVNLDGRPTIADGKTGTPPPSTSETPGESLLRAHVVRDPAPGPAPAPPPRPPAMLREHRGRT